MKRYRMCDSVEGHGARWTRSADLQTLTISITSAAACMIIRSNSFYKAEKVFKGSDYDGWPAAQPILDVIANYLQTSNETSTISRCFA